MRLSKYLTLFALAFFIGASCSGCDDESEAHTSDRCPERTCELCDDHSDCADGTYCDEDQGEMVCVLQDCDPGDMRCEDGAQQVCNETGSQWLAPEICASGECDGDRCACVGDQDCGAGFECDDGSCVCPSNTLCGEPSACCEATEICDGAGACVPACAGDVCGVDDELCCEGDIPTCGPTLECVVDCSNQGMLCGDNLDECCEQGDICLYGVCHTPGEDCDDFRECGFGEYCDQGIGKCVPDEFPEGIDCGQEADFEEMDIEEKWSWTEDNTTSTPVVGDVTGDGEPNVVILTFGGDVVALDGEGEEVLRAGRGDDVMEAYWRSNPALADVTGDGQMEVIYVTDSGHRIVAMDGDGDKVWEAHDENGDAVEWSFNAGSIGAANLNGDASTAEIMAGAVVIDSQGRVVWNEDGDGTVYGRSGGYIGGMTIAVDLTGDGKHELVTGQHAWTLEWNSEPGSEDWPDVDVELLWKNEDGDDGYPAVADIDGNGKPEVVLFASHELRIIEGDTGELWCGVDPTGQACEDDPDLRTQPKPDPTGGRSKGGAPTVADFSGDGRPEVGVAGRHYITVFDFYRPGFGNDDTPEDIDHELLAQYGQDEPEVGEIFIRWYLESQDGSAATGASVFDFQGDGSASVIYNDECFLRVYNGYDGEVVLEKQNSSGTRTENPIVVDVDQNGRSEIVVIANDQSRSCDDWDSDPYEERRGVYVYEDPNQMWVHTRSVWNQHAYSIDNINDDGSVPDVVDNWWEDHNTFRANRQGRVPLNAADVELTSVEVDNRSCPPDLQLQITIKNAGLNTIPEGLPITVYDVDTGEALETIVIDEIIAPGAAITTQISYEIPEFMINVDITLQVVANDDGEGDGDFVYDCNPDSATQVLQTECLVEL